MTRYCIEFNTVTWCVEVYYEAPIRSIYSPDEYIIKHKTFLRFYLTKENERKAISCARDMAYTAQHIDEGTLLLLKRL